MLPAESLLDTPRMPSAMLLSDTLTDSVLRPKLNKPSFDGFQDSTTKLSISFQAQTEELSINGFQALPSNFPCVLPLSLPGIVDLAPHDFKYLWHKSRIILHHFGPSAWPIILHLTRSIGMTYHPSPSLGPSTWSILVIHSVVYYICLSLSPAKLQPRTCHTQQHLSIAHH